ncbi:MAG: ATP-binding cassette domain-containing protein [Thermodesulfobacteriota bacterium]
MGETALSCENLFYDLDGFELFDGLSFKLEIGQAGLLLAEPQLRSRRLLQICATLRNPVRGEVSWFGRCGGPFGDIQRLDLRRRLAYVHREARLVSNMTILDNIVLGLIYHRNISHKAAEDHVSGLLQRFGLYKFRHRRPAEVSYHVQRQAVYLRELTKKPSLFLLEVPAVDLDQDFDLMMEVINETVTRKEAALLLSDLSGGRVLEMVDWVLVMRESGHALQSADEFDQAQYARFLDECRRTWEEKD